MIRNLRADETNKVMEIWKESTIEAHRFIHEDYWLKNYSIVKQNLIPTATTYVYDDNKTIKGVVSILNNLYIGAIFVDLKYQKQGIGTDLINYLKDHYNKLKVTLYKDNNSVEFYKKLNFIIEKEQLNEETNKVELIMSWKK